VAQKCPIGQNQFLANQNFRIHRKKDFTTVIENFTDIVIASKISDFADFTIFYSVFQNYTEKNGQSLVSFNVQCSTSLKVYFKARSKCPS